MSEDNLMYKTEQLLMTRTIQMEQHLCTLGMSNIAHMERSPTTVHPDALIRARGHIIQELECQSVQVSVTLGYQRGDQCHLDYLPVYLGKEAVYLDATGMIATAPLLHCNKKH